MDSDTLLTLRKVAATQTPDDKAIEQAFAEQAYMSVQNKAGPLLKDPYRIGFEIVNKNDDNTRLLAVWQFRLGNSSEDQLLQAPLMFINGRILGSDLLYRMGPKKFTCLTPEWAQYLIDSESQDFGRSQPKSETAKLHNQFRPETFLRTPAAFGKLASSDLVDNWQELVTDWCTQTKVGGVLRDFVANHGKSEAIDQMMEWVQKSAKFERAVAKYLPVESWLPPEMQLNKQASAEPDKPRLIFFCGEPTREKLANAINPEKVAADLYRKGYSFDTPDVTPVPEHDTVVYDGSPSELRSPTEPCCCHLIVASGDRVKAVVARSESSWNLFQSGADCVISCNSSRFDGANEDDYAGVRSRNRATPLRVVALDHTDNGIVWEGTRALWSEPDDAGLLGEVGVPITEMSEGKLYGLLHPVEAIMLEPAYVLEMRKVGEVHHALLAFGSGSSGMTVIVNPDSQKAWGDHVLNGEWRAIEIPFTKGDADGFGPPCGMASESRRRAPSWHLKQLSPASGADVTASILGMPYTKKATLKCDQDHFTLQIGDRECLPVKVHVMEHKMASLLGIHPTDVEEMLKSAQEKGKAEYFLQFPAKHASAMLRIVDSPRFEQTVDPIHQVLADRDQYAILRTERTPINYPNARIGDKQDSLRGVRNAPDSSMEAQRKVPIQMILSASPDELAQFAEMHQLPHVFDHGIMASMAKTYDSQLFIDQYLVKLEDGLDSLARCLFLYYWKPQDWKKMYGSDDLQELEDQLLSVFKSTGDLLLALLKKSRNSSANPS